MEEANSLAFYLALVEADKPGSGLGICTGCGRGGLEGGRAVVDCVNMGIFHTVSHISSLDSNVSLYFGGMPT